MRILLTGAAGFIGFHCATRLLNDEHEVVGVDNLNGYYQPALKTARLQRLLPNPRFRFERSDVSDRAAMETLFSDTTFDCVIHLAAQAGVRYSLENPHAYIDSNVVGFLNILEGCRARACPHLIYASSSSVYGGNDKVPFEEHDRVDTPISLYAATKRSNELMAHAYSHLFGFVTTGLRFFTVYGPWGRPDMAMWLFTEAIVNNRPIDVFNHGDQRRDFTYIDDIVEGVVRLAYEGPGNLEADSNATVFNIGNNQPVALLEFISAIEDALGMSAQKRMLPRQPGDVQETYAEVSRLQRAVGFEPHTPLRIGVRRFCDWYRHTYLQGVSVA